MPRYLIPHLAERSAERRPDAEAFRCLGASLSYAALSQRSNRLARALTAEGVRRGDRVGIHLHKGLHAAVALYGIMKAGAAYVPLDPGAPLGRLRQMIRHCGIRHLVTQPQKRETLRALGDDLPLACVIGLPAGDDLPLRCVDWPEVEALSGEAPPDAGTTELDLAYIMYTSGSTGTPKGIMHTHYSGLAYARLAAATYGVGPDDRLGNHSPLHFDMSTFDYFSGPLAGATTVIIPEAHARLPASLSQLIEDERLSIWYSVPFALTQLLLRGVLGQRRLDTLRWVLFGGEPFPPRHLHALMRLWPQARFSNVYGPAEVNQCSYHHLDAPAGDDDTPVPIGRVWANTEALVVDDGDRPLPPGQPGELLVRTPTMMRGYWNEPALNARAFYRRPVSGDVVDLFYRTGDLVVAGPDGSMRFLGRKDRQIKTRGHRVELDEVEAALAAHPQVEEAAAFAPANDAGSRDVAAAVVLRAPAATTVAALRAHAAGLLPAYAVPARIFIMESFPRTGSGKIDRRRIEADAASTGAEDHPA